MSASLFIVPTKNEKSYLSTDDAKIMQRTGANSSKWFPPHPSSTIPLHSPINTSRVSSQCPPTWKGDFGHVKFAQESHLSKTFAVKKANLDQRNLAIIVFCFEFDMALGSATCATSILGRRLNSNVLATFHYAAHFCQASKRFRHPNITVLDRFNLNVSITD